MKRHVYRERDYAFALLKALRGHLRGLDLSGLSIRGASLQGVEMQDANLAGAQLEECVWTQSFDAIWSVATSSPQAVPDRHSHRWQRIGDVLHLIQPGAPLESNMQRDMQWDVTCCTVTSTSLLRYSLLSFWKQ